MNPHPDHRSLVENGAQAIKTGFDAYRFQFQAITERAASRFEQRDWHGMQQDAVQRLDLYTRVVLDVQTQILALLTEALREKQVWVDMKKRYSHLIRGMDDVELAETFFNSITRRIFITVGVDPQIEFVDSDFALPSIISIDGIFRTYHCQANPAEMIRRIFADYRFQRQYENLDRDVSLSASALGSHLEMVGVNPVECTFQILKPVFFRGKGAYLVGRISQGSRCLPLIFALRNSINGVFVDALLLTEDQASILFSFTRSYFHVQTADPRQLTEFLKELMPRKRVAELYTAIGYNKHGKTELYRDLLSHLDTAQDQFIEARGEKGMVMLVFTLPSYDLVFKVIRDRFADPKTSSRQDVMERYQLVFKHDRAGRLVDAQEFEHLRFEKERFSPELLHALVEGAPSSVKVDGDRVTIRHLYTERRLIPLNLYLVEAGGDEARKVVLDYGYAIKDLAATNIFPGDILLKNFGVTRHGRVVFYDYDELTLLTQCRFRFVPRARSFSDDFEAEPWFFVDQGDIFPEEFETFLGLQGELRQLFIQEHGDIFGVEFWRRMQELVKSGEVADVLPYQPQSRLQATGL